MDNKKFSRILTPGVSLYFWTIFLLIGILIYYNYWLAILGLGIFAYLFYHNARNKYVTNREIKKYIENLTFHLDTATKDTLLHFPLPMVVLQLNGIITWYNAEFASIFENQALFEQPITSFVEELDVKQIISKQQGGSFSLSLHCKNKYYKVMGNIVKIESRTDTGYIIVLYWMDHTELTQLKQKIEQKKSVESIIMIDNYDEVMQSTDDANRPQVLAEIDKRVTKCVSFTNGVLKKFERDKYILIFEHQYLKVFEEKKFDVLDQIREINMGNTIPVTLSIGIGLNGETVTQNDIYAKAAIDIALGRGGDQVVINDHGKLRFFGGKTKEVEKRTKVKARVMAYALRGLMRQSSQVLIMGHQNADIDVIGAAIGLYGAVKRQNQKGYIVLGSYNETVENMLGRLEKNEGYQDAFITPSQAIDIIDGRTLLIVVDTHRSSFTDCPTLLERTNHVVVIDHHRRAAEFIENTVLVYHEPYASSTCEMVTEVLQYIEDDIKLSTIEAEALYAGIAIDTKNFTFKTGVRTFEAASFLRRAGVDTVSVKQLFQSDLDTYVARADIVKAAQVYRKHIAISATQSTAKNIQMVIAQAADEMINIKDVKASFVLCDIEDTILISGRSWGQMNVQVVLEKLGGGGHLSVAGAQLTDVTLEEAQDKLKQMIDEYLDS